MIKLPEKRYIENEGWVGLDSRYWIRVIKKKRWCGRPKYKLEMIMREDYHDTEDEAIEYAKHILWCWHELIKRESA